MHSICQNDKKAQIIKNVSQKAFHNVYKMSLQAKTHEIEQLFKGYWGISPGATKT